MDTPFVILSHGVCRAQLGPGDTVGRHPRANLSLQDSRVSELHAYVSQRGGQLVLMALRGALCVDGIAVSEATLEEGLEIELVPSVVLLVEAVVGLPSYSAPDPVPATEGRAAASPLRITTRYDSVCVAPLRGDPLVVGGLPAKILYELIACGQAAHWSVVARELWPSERELSVLRSRWDKALAAARRKLRDGGIRENLIATDAGQVQLTLYPHDSIDRES